jgi:cystathionine beta-synthase
VVVHIPDSGRGYLSKLYSDGWMSDHGFLKAAGMTVGDLLALRDPSLPPLVHVHPDETVRQAIDAMREYGVSQVPVIKHELPVVLAEVVGAITEHQTMERAFADASILDRPVAEAMGDPLPTVGAGEPLDVAVSRLRLGSAMLVLDRGHPIGVVTRVDVLTALAAPTR